MKAREPWLLDEDIQRHAQKADRDPQNAPQYDEEKSTARNKIPFTVSVDLPVI